MWEFVKKGSFVGLCLVMAVVLHNGNCEIPSKRIVPVLETVDDIQNALSGYVANSNKIAIFLDYDGTLATLTARPEDTAMTKEVEHILRGLAANPLVFLCVISGRSISNIKTKVPLRNVTFGGNHGIEIENVDGSRSDFELPFAVKESYSKMLAELNEKVAKHGAWVEDKTFSLTYHYAETPTEYIVALRDEAIRIIESYGFLAQTAHFAIEGKPPVNWNKGTIPQKLLAQNSLYLLLGEATKLILQNNFGNNWRNDIKIIFIGDDNTDEDAMKALQGSGRTFRITADYTLETYADYRLPSLDLTPVVLKWIANYYSQQLNRIKRFT